MARQIKKTLILKKRSIKLPKQKTTTLQLQKFQHGR